MFVLGCKCIMCNEFALHVYVYCLACFVLCSDCVVLYCICTVLYVYWMRTVMRCNDCVLDCIVLYCLVSVLWLYCLVFELYMFLCSYCVCIVLCCCVL